MPHTIVDIKKPLAIPAASLVWGLVTDEADLEANSMPIKELANVNGRMNKGDMFFEGDGAVFTASFRDRIHHILEANGAFYAGNKKRGHAQKNQNISFNTIQPYPEGEQEGVYPTIIIRP